jgi:hypothetical protein
MEIGSSLKMEFGSINSLEKMAKFVQKYKDSMFALHNTRLIKFHHFLYKIRLVLIFCLEMIAQI